MLIGIAGGTGSGKTYLTRKIASCYGEGDVTVIDYDSYYKDQSQVPAETRDQLNFDHPDSLDHDLLVSHLMRLLSGRRIQKPMYDFAHHVRLSDTQTISPARIILLEGIFALWDIRVRCLMGYKIFVAAEPDLRLIRRLQRDLLERNRCAKSVLQQYLDSVRPMHEAFIEPTKVFADEVVNNSNRFDLRPILSEIQHRLINKRGERECGNVHQLPDFASAGSDLSAAAGSKAARRHD